MNPINISELCTMETPPKVARGIICDQASFTPPEGVRIAAFTYEIDNETGEYKEDLLDTLVAWGVIARTNVLQERKIVPIIEIPFGTETISAEQALYVAAAGGVSISLLPPDEFTPDNISKWISTIELFGKTMLNTTHFGGRLYPFNDALEIVFLEALSEQHGKFGHDNVWDDKQGHILTKTYSKMVFGETDIDLILPAIRKIVYEHFGTAENFKAFAKQIPALCWDKTEDAVQSKIKTKKRDENQRQTCETQ